MRIMIEKKKNTVIERTYLIRKCSYVLIVVDDDQVGIPSTLLNK